ncbi:hypothetical protein HAT91_02293 [Dickeya solani]|nr:hypothetical protein HAT91_02293 [Dickeya solani]
MEKICLHVMMTRCIHYLPAAAMTLFMICCIITSGEMD